MLGDFVLGQFNICVVVMFGLSGSHLALCM